MNTFGLSEKERDLVWQICRRHPEIAEVRIFGSRAKGNHEANSDIDLAFLGEMTFQLLARVAAELDELPLPYTFDVSIYDEVQNQDLKEHIDRVGSVLYRRDTRPTPAV
jgi:predicted nucleotidyltransferase